MQSGAHAVGSAHRAGGATGPAVSEFDATFAVVHLTAGFCVGLAIKHADRAVEVGALQGGVVAPAGWSGGLFRPCGRGPDQCQQGYQQGRQG